MACGPRGSAPCPGGAHGTVHHLLAALRRTTCLTFHHTNSLRIAPGAARAPDRAEAIAQHSEVVCRAVVRSSRPDHSLFQMLPHLHTSRCAPGAAFGLAWLICCRACDEQCAREDTNQHRGAIPPRPFYDAAKLAGMAPSSVWYLRSWSQMSFLRSVSVVSEVS